MQWVIFATLPGIFVANYLFGWGVIINVLWASLVAVISEALILFFRGKPISHSLKDSSAILTAVLLALALPATAPWWLTLLGVSLAIILAKQLYGGLGFNPFNPAMVGYVILLISFPTQLSLWPTPLPLEGHHGFQWDRFTQDFTTIFNFLNDHTNIDATTMATPLDALKIQPNESLSTLANQSQAFTNLFGFTVSYGWLAINLAFLLGGLILLQRRIISWHAPLGLIIGLLIISSIFNQHGSPLFHLFSGATMLGAFFIATDPVTSATSPKGRFIFGIGIGLLIFIIRTWGGYPDGVAFAVLLMNFAAPFIDYYTQPRTFGHTKPNSKLKKLN